MPSIQLVMDANERVIGLGDNTEEAARQVARAEGFADAAASSAASAANGVAQLDAVNLWPDLDFRLSQGDEAFTIDGFTLHSHVYNNKTWDADFVGPQSKGAWVYDSGSSTFMGFELWLGGPGFGELGVTEGDVISVASEVSGSSGVPRMALRWFSAKGGSYTWASAQVGSVIGDAFSDDTQILKSENITVPAGAVGLSIYLFDGAASDFALTRLWATRGATVSNTPPVRDTALSETRVIQSLTDPISARANYAVADDVAYSSVTPVLTATGKSITARTAAFKGWGDVLAPSGETFNAIRFTTASHGSTGGVTMNVVVRAGTAGTAHTTSSDIVAIGSARINPAKSLFSDVVIALRDPETSAFKTLTDSDLSEEYFVGYWFADADGVAIGSCGEIVGTMPNRATTPRSYYSAQTNPQAGSWTDYSGDGPIALDHVLLADVVADYALTDAALADVAAGQSSLAPDVFNPSALRQYAKRVTAGEAVTIAFIGDSWTNSAYRLFGPMRARFLDAFGISAPGYCSINTGVSAPSNMTRARNGTWTDVRSSTAAIGPDNSHATTTDTGADATFTPATSVAQWFIHYLQQPDGGSFTYAVGGGSPVTVDTDGTLSYEVIEVTGSGTGALVLDVTAAGSAGVTIAGVEARNNTAGEVLLHKLGSGGARASHFAGMGSGYLEAAYTSLAPDVVVICLGTNDHAASVSLADFKGQLGTIVNEVRAGASLADILLLGPGPNDTAVPTPVEEYIAQIYALAVDLDCAFVNLMAGFGSYDEANARGLYEDAVHPNAAGGLVNARTIWRGMFIE